jgi:hypothetical protein
VHGGDRRGVVEMHCVVRQPLFFPLTRSLWTEVEEEKHTTFFQTGARSAVTGARTPESSIQLALIIRLSIDQYTGGLYTRCAHTHHRPLPTCTPVSTCTPATNT